MFCLYIEGKMVVVSHVYIYITTASCSLIFSHSDITVVGFYLYVSILCLSPIMWSHVMLPSELSTDVQHLPIDVGGPQRCQPGHYTGQCQV